jgi:hypothetical protein
MKKITVDKEDGIAEVIDHLLDASDDEITLVIPKGSALIRSMSNFRLLKREADAAGKDVAVESVDDTALSFAKECGIQAVHPLWRGVRTESDEEGTRRIPRGHTSGGGMSDIVPKSHRATAPSPVASRHRDDDDDREDPEEEDDASEREENDRDENTDSAVQRPAALGRRASFKNDGPRPSARLDEDEEGYGDEPADEEDGEDEIEEEVREEVSAARRFFGDRRPFFSDRARGSRDGSRSSRSQAFDDDDDADNGPRRRIGGKVWTVLVIVLVLFGIGAYVASADFNHANVTITFKKTPWSWQGNLTADTSVGADDLANGTIAAQLFTANKDITQTFHASGQSNVSLKATGMITIYNDYSTKPQELVATTRFLTPDGKIFRITKNVVVPGATNGAGGALQASSITVPIVADQAGPNYNIGPVAKLSIPGFQGDPQYGHFWGTITASTTGGYIGQRAVPTAADITAAKASTTAALQNALQGGFSGTYPNNFKILSGATNVTVGGLVVNTTTDSQGNFTVYATATLSAIGFDESALKTALLADAQTTEASSSFADITLNYTNVSPNFAKGQVSFSLSAQGDLEPALVPVDFEQQLLGKSVASARTVISSLPQLSNAEISVWPVWLGTIPSNAAKVSVTVH